MKFRNALFFFKVYHNIRNNSVLNDYSIQHGKITYKQFVIYLNSSSQSYKGAIGQSCTYELLHRKIILVGQFVNTIKLTQPSFLCFS